MPLSGSRSEAGQKIRSIYVVDDDDNVRASLQFLLALRSDQVVQSFSRGGLFLADAGSLAPGVLLLDFHMPGTGGMEVLGILNRLHPGKFASLVLTGVAGDDLVIPALRAGAFDFIEKPCEAVVLLGTIDAAFSSLAQDSTAVQCATAARAGIAGLSGRERDVLMGLIEGHSSNVIASALDISSRAVDVCRGQLLTKLGVRNLSSALRIAFAAGIIGDA